MTAFARSVLLLAAMLAASAGCAVHYSPRPARYAAPSDYAEFLADGDPVAHCALHSSHSWKPPMPSGGR